MIEEHGVSIYDSRQLPPGLDQINYKNKLTIKTDDTTLLRRIENAIQDSHVKVKFEHKKITFKGHPQGRLICSVIELDRIQQSSNFKP